MTIIIKNLKKQYNNKNVVDIQSLILNRDSITGLVGNNGVGKTTLLKLIVGLLRPNNGEIRIDNYLVHKKNEQWKKNMGSFIGFESLIDYLTPLEYLFLIGKIYGLSNYDVNNAIASVNLLEKSILTNSRKYIKDYSQGIKQVVGILASLIMRPQILILDEPYNYLDPSTQLRLTQYLKKIKEEFQPLIFLSSHNVNHIYKVCDDILLMEDGNILMNLKNTEKNKDIIHEYFKLSKSFIDE